MEATEAPVAHHEHDVAGPGLGGDPGDQRGDVRRGVRLEAARAEIGDQARDVELLAVRDLVVLLGSLEADPRRAVEAAGVVRLVEVPAAGVGARLEDGPQPPAGQRPRTAAMVSRTAVGWWAKSSTTSDAAGPRRAPPGGASRRGTLRSPAAISSKVSPSAAERPRPRPSAFSTLWRPGQRQRWTAAERAARVARGVKRAPSGPAGQVARLHQSAGAPVRRSRSSTGRAGPGDAPPRRARPRTPRGARPAAARPTKRSKADS